MLLRYTWAFLLCKLSLIEAIYENFVYASFTYKHSYPMLEAGAHTWRKHVKSLFVESGPNGSSEKESTDRPAYLNPLDKLWLYADHPAINVNVPFIPRSLASVRIANKTFSGKYDWLLYSDDEGIFFMDRISRIVEGLDPSVPYYICDNIMDSCNHYSDGKHVPLGETAYCVLPSMTAAKHRTHSECVRNAAVAPCTAKAVMAARECHAPGRGQDGWHFCNGNQGAVISRGLIDSVSEAEWTRCEREGRHPYSDVAMGNCVWEFGFAPTNPTDRADEPQFSRCVFGRMNAEQYTEAALKAVGNASSVEQEFLMDAATTWVKHHANLTKNSEIVENLWNARGAFLASIKFKV